MRFDFMKAFSEARKVMQANHFGLTLVSMSIFFKLVLAIGLLISGVGANTEAQLLNLYQLDLTFLLMYTVVFVSWMGESSSERYKEVLAWRR